MTTTYYLAGPMSGHAEHNFPAFHEAAATLRATGYGVVSPAEVDEAEGFDHEAAADVVPGSAAWGGYLARDLALIAREDVSGVVVLPGWESSTGAGWEVAWARQLGKPVLAYPLLTEVTGGHGNDGKSEERITNPATGGQKGRKPQRYELLPWPAVGEVAEVYAFGATKYDDHNWLRGYAWSLSYGAMLRHLALFWGGEDRDPESGLPHVAHAAFHCLALLTYAREHPELDDRPRVPR